MSHLRFATFLSCLFLGGLFGEVREQELDSEDFECREEAAAALLEWAQAGQTGERTNQLRARYLTTSDPEERIRLREILYDLIPRKGPGAIGISMARQFPGEPPPDEDGVRASFVFADTPAEKAGLKANDLILEVAGEGLAVANPGDRLKEIVSSKNPGQEIVLKIRRNEEELELRLKLMSGQALMEGERTWSGELVEPDWQLQKQLMRRDFEAWLHAEEREESPQ